VLVFSPTVLAPCGPVLFLVPEVEQRGKLGVGNDHHIAPITAVSAVGAAARHEFLPAKAYTTASARTRFHVDSYLIDELHGQLT
jgi:hypothetical protein